MDDANPACCGLFAILRSRLPGEVTSKRRRFHESLPGFSPSRLLSCPAIAKELGLKSLHLKLETDRLGLPAFKVLGASWAVRQALIGALHLDSDVSLGQLQKAAAESDLMLVTASQGNHGMAVAHIGSVLSLHTTVFVPFDCEPATLARIASKGAEVVVCSGDYDDAVRQAYASDMLLIQDTAFDDYTLIPNDIVEGYGTLMDEVFEHITPDWVVTPVGVGSLAQAVVTACTPRKVKVLTVEPESAACLVKSLAANAPTQVETSNTILAGMNCGTLSSIAWPILSQGVSRAVAVTDAEVQEELAYLQHHNAQVGPCSAATLAAVRKARLGHVSVVLLCTEGPR